MRKEPALPNNGQYDQTGSDERVQTILSSLILARTCRILSLKRHVGLCVLRCAVGDIGGLFSRLYHVHSATSWKGIGKSRWGTIVDSACVESVQSVNQYEISKIVVGSQK